jgi:glutamate-1-semialdehyde 2,1-aminomutase
MNTYEKSRQLNERAKKVLAGGVSSEFRKFNQPHPLFYERGEGAHIWDVDGNDFLDFTLSQGPLILGHSPSHVLQRVEEYSRHGQIFAGQHLLELELAEKLQSLIPCAELMRFSLSGSESDHAAIRLARAATGRQKFVRFEGHYHGWFDNVVWGMSGTREQIGPRENPTPVAWTAGLPERISEECISLPWNDLELLEKVVSERKDEICAIITEGVMCNNGCIPPVPGFLEGIRAICDKHGIVFILDEVITGFRLSMGGAQKYFGIVPDLAIFGKAMANGYPISALVGKEKYMKLIADGTVIHAGTMNGGNPCIAAAVATIEVLERDDTHKKLFRLGKKLMEGLQKAGDDSPHDVLVQGMGPMLNVSFTGADKILDYRGTLDTDKAKNGKFIWGMQERGIRLIGRGLWYISNAHTEDDIDRAIATATEVLQEMEME